MQRFIFIIVFFLLFVSCEKEKERPHAPSSGLPEQEVFGFDVTESRKGVKLWNLKANNALVFGDTTVIYSVALTFFDKGGDTSSILISDSGYVFEKSSNMRAMGNVKVIAKEKTLHTEVLEWNNKENKIVSEEKVRIETPRGIILGKGFESNPDLTQMKLRESYGYSE